MLKHDFSHLISHSANGRYLSSVYLAAGILDTFFFFPGPAKRQSSYTEALVSGLPSVPYTVSGNLQARVGVAAAQPIATWVMKGLACLRLLAQNSPPC